MGKKSRNKKSQNQNLPAKNQAPELHPRIQASYSHVRGEITVSPLPNPADYGAYEQILPGAAERLMHMAEKEQEHVHAMQREDQKIFSRAVDYDYKGFRAGQWMGFGVALLAMIFAFALAWKGNNAAATGFGITGVGILVGIFIRSRFMSVNQEKPDPKN